VHRDFLITLYKSIAMNLKEGFKDVNMVQMAQCPIVAYDNDHEYPSKDETVSVCLKTQFVPRSKHSPPRL
jgi:hypothetical protein